MTKIEYYREWYLWRFRFVITGGEVRLQWRMRDVEPPVYTSLVPPAAWYRMKNAAYQRGSTAEKYYITDEGSLTHEERAIGSAYELAQTAWESYLRSHPEDHRNGSELYGSPEADEVARLWKLFLALWNPFTKARPLPIGMNWGIAYHPYRPEAYKNALGTKLDDIKSKFYLKKENITK